MNVSISKVGPERSKLRCLAGELLVAICVQLPGPLAAQTNPVSFPIDLATALRLAGAQNLDVQIAREKLAEAKANQDSAQLQFFPRLAPGIAYRRHDNQIQDVAGSIIDVHKQSYAPGIALAAQLDLGDAIYKSLAAKQLVKAADFALQAQRQESVTAAALGYFDLAFARAAIGVAREAVRISTNYQAQLAVAVDAGLAFKGDLLRVQVQSERNQQFLRQAVENERTAGARLAQTLHLDPSIALDPGEGDLVAISLIETNASLLFLLNQAVIDRPELHQSQSLSAAAREAKKGVQYGPWIPTVGAQVFVGGLGGGKGGDLGNFGDQEDYFFGLSWKIGPGGIFDRSRQRSFDARLKSTELTTAKVRDDITRQVVEAYSRWQSQQDQMSAATRGLAAAVESLRLTQSRKEFGVGIVLETITAEQDLTRARQDYLKTIVQFNQSQFSLRQAVGGK